RPAAGDVRSRARRVRPGAQRGGRREAPVDERVTREELKRVHAAIERHAEAIVAIAEQIRRHPELGFKEWKTAALVEAEFRRLGLALTGLRADVVGVAGLVGAAIGL